MAIRITERLTLHVQPALTDSGVQALEARGLCPVLATQYGVTSAHGPGRSDWLAYPSVVHGKVAGWQFRRIGEGDPRFITTGEAAKVVWNADVLDDGTLADQPLVITEGRADALAAIQSGFPRTVSIPGGAAETKSGEVRDSAYRFVGEIEPKLKSAKQIIIATDGDAPGLQMMDDIAKRLGRGRCAYIEWPEGCKDLNDVLLGFGEGAVAGALNGVKWLHVEGVFLPCELPPRPRLRQHVSGMPGLDEHYRIRRQDWCVVTGWPGSGKTTWLNDLAVRMAENHGWRTCFASFEQSPQTQHMWNLRRLRLGKSPDQMSADDVKQADAWINEYIRFVVPDEERVCDLDWLFEMLGTSIVRHGTDMVVVDPWNELEHAVPSGQSLTQYTGNCIRDMKRFAKKWDVHFVVIAHPAKPMLKPSETPPEPRLDQISDSAHWWNKADVGVVLHHGVRDDGRKYVSTRIAKSKYHDEIGKPGVVGMTLDTHTGRYQFCTI